MVNFAAILLSLVIHIIALTHLSRTTKPKEIKNSTNTPIKIKLKVLKEIKRKNSKGKSLNFTMLGVKANELTTSRYAVHTNKSISIQKNINLFKLIDTHLNYPKELVENNIKGSVVARFYIEKDGSYDESKTKIKSNSGYLRVHFARILKRAMNSTSLKRLMLKKRTRFEVSIHFALSTDQKPNNQSQILDDRFFYYRQDYGVSTKADTIYKGISKTLIHLTSWASFLEYLPDSESTKVKKLWKLRNYEKSSFY